LIWLNWRRGMDGDRRAHAGAGNSHHTADGDSKVIGDTKINTIGLVTELAKTKGEDNG
jgi:hypothetical protein